jgi:hypothetical protein
MLTLFARVLHQALLPLAGYYTNAEEYHSALQVYARHTNKQSTNMENSGKILHEKVRPHLQLKRI